MSLGPRKSKVARAQRAPAIPRGAVWLVHEFQRSYIPPIFSRRVFLLRLPDRLLSRVFRQDVEDRFHHGADCLRASHWGVLLGDPCIEGFEVGGLQAHLYGRSLACWGGSPFLWLHSLLCHETVVPYLQPGGKGEAPAPGLTRNQRYSPWLKLTAIIAHLRPPTRRGA